MSRFSNKVVLVTGALGGIGSAVVRRLASEGARLAITDRDKTAADVPPDLAAGADDSIFFAADLTRERRWRRYSAPSSTVTAASTL